MKKIKIILGLIILGIFSVLLNAEENKKNGEYTLEKVVILSRHGLRAPLSTPGSTLSKVTPYEWVAWDVEASYLTKKGVRLEVNFGQYMSEWLDQNGIKTSKLKEEEALVYTNSLQRTIATGQALAAGMFPGTNIKSIHKMEIGKFDPVFNPQIRTADKMVLEEFASQMELEKANKELDEAYKILNRVINYKNSELCLKEKKCNFSEDNGKITLAKDKEPSVTGVIRIGTQIADALLLQYYERDPINKIANGNIKTNKEWKLINDIKNKYGDLLFASNKSAAHIAKPLIEYMNSEFENDNRKVVVLVGHDSNAASVLSALEVKPYILENQHETTPIGSKIFFEIWKNNRTNEKKVKIEYIYQTTNQIRSGEIINLKNKPMHKILELKNCPIDKDGYCPYEKFDNIIKDIVKNN